MGQAKKSKNYVEEEKRVARNYGMYSGFDTWLYQAKAKSMQIFEGSKAILDLAEHHLLFNCQICNDIRGQ